jgi:hypothetical protein
MTRHTTPPLHVVPDQPQVIHVDVIEACTWWHDALLNEDVE